MSEFAAPCTPCTKFQLLNTGALRTRSMLSATCTTSGTEESSSHLCTVELLSIGPVSRMSEGWSSLQQHRRFRRKHPEWRSLRRVRSSSLRPRRNRSHLVKHREHHSSVVGRYLAVSKRSRCRNIRFWVSEVQSCRFAHLLQVASQGGPTAPAHARRRRSRNCHPSTTPPCRSCLR